MKTIIFGVIALALGGCQTTGVAPPQTTAFSEVAIPQAQPMVMQKVEWKVYNLAELKKLVAQLEKEGKKDFAIFALTPDGYRALSNNMTEIERFIKEQKEVTIMLKRIVEERAKPNG